MDVGRDQANPAAHRTTEEHRSQGDEENHRSHAHGVGGELTQRAQRAPAC